VSTSAVVMRSQPFDPRQGLNYLIRVRLAVITFLLVVQLLVARLTESTQPPGPFVATIVLWYTLTILFAILLRIWPEYTTQSYLQILSDAIILTGLVYLSGGVESYFIFLFPLLVVAAGISLPRPGPYLVASLSFILLGGVLELSYYKIIPSYSEHEVDSNKMQASIFTNLFGFMSVAYLSSYLADSLRRTGRQLTQTSGALENLQAFNQNVLDSIAAGVITIDLAGRVQLLNHAGEAILGQPLGSLVGRRLEEALPEVASAQQAPPGKEVELTTPGGKERTVGVTVSPLTSTDGGSLGNVFVMQDLTEFKRLQQELRLQDRMAALGRMAGAIAHEIRNPLSAIAGSVKVFSVAGDLSEDQERLVDIVRKESERLDRTLAEFLTYSRERKYHFERADLGAMLEETVTLIRHRPGADRWKLSIILPPRPVIVLADVDAIKQVFWNLCDNALKAMPEGGTLTLQASADRGFGMVQFQDSGPGIPARQLEKIFEPFQSGFTFGAGLGLAIVYEIVTAHQGKITVETVTGEEGKVLGSRFRLSLPRPVV
jgi:two-component system sensor histidine kinase PilS (NtrC family)